MSKTRSVFVEINYEPGENISTHVNIREVSRVSTSIPVICPICRKSIEKGSVMYRISSNSILFPNVFIHKKCTKHFGLDVTLNSDDTWSDICVFLRNDYMTALSMKKYYKCWLE